MTAGRGLGVRPTAFGTAFVVTLVLVAVLRPAVADPAMAGLLWSGLVAMAALGCTWPFVVVLRARVVSVGAPTDAVLGDETRMSVRVGAPAPGVLVDVAEGLGHMRPVPPTDPQPTPSGAQDVRVTLLRRGVLTFLPVVVTADGPFGLLRVQRCLHVPLPATLSVGPRPEPTEASVADIDAAATEMPHSGSASIGDTVRSVRPYVVGDPAHLVHWPSSARTGELVVREMEPPPNRGVAIVVDLGESSPVTGAGPPWSMPADPCVEAAVSRACGAALWALAEGASVVLCTNTAGLASTSRVQTPREVMRVLAGAIPGPTGVPPERWHVMRISAEGRP